MLNREFHCRQKTSRIRRNLISYKQLMVLHDGQVDISTERFGIIHLLHTQTKGGLEVAFVLVRRNHRLLADEDAGNTYGSEGCQTVDDVFSFRSNRNTLNFLSFLPAAEGSTSQNQAKFFCSCVKG